MSNETKNSAAAAAAKENPFEVAKSNVIIRTKQVPKTAFIYRSQSDLKALIDFTKMQPKARVDESGKLILSLGKYDISENVLVMLSEVGKVSDIISLDKANELYEVVASK